MSPPWDEEKRDILAGVQRDQEPEFRLLLAPVDPPDGEEGEGEPEGGDEVQPPLFHCARDKLGWAEDGMGGDHKQVKKEEEKEGFAVPCNLVRQRLKANTEMATKFQLDKRVVKAGACIDSLIRYENVPLADDREEKRRDESRKTSHQEDKIPQQKNNLPTAT